MATKIIGYTAAAIGVSVALSLVTIGSASAAPRWGGAIVGPYGGSYDYPAGAYGSSYYDYSGYPAGPHGWPYNGYDSSDDSIVARPAFPPGCGAGEPHC